MSSNSNSNMVAPPTTSYNKGLGDGWEQQNAGGEESPESAMTRNTTTPAAVKSTAGSSKDSKPKNKYPIQMVQFNDIIKKLNTQLEYDRLLQEEQVRIITTETYEFFKGLFIQAKKDPDDSSDNSSSGSSSYLESNSTDSITSKSSTKTDTEVTSDKDTKRPKSLQIW